jgi:thiamine-phosphate pyrophosphorylase
MAVVDADIASNAGWTIADLGAAYLEGGATLLQLRAKNASSGELFEAARALVSLAHRAGARVIVNDRADIARESGADGVHVGQDDLTPASIRAIVGPHAIVGLSTHTPEQLDAALEQPITYAALGPLFGTSTKETGYDAVGLEGLRTAAARARDRGVPLVVIGGITLETAGAAIDAGATSVAVITDLLVSGRPADRVRAYLKHLTV